MKKLLLLTALAMSISAGAIAQESDAGTSTGTTGGATEGTSGAGGISGSDGGDTGAGNTTNAPNAPFLGNRDRIGAFYSDDGLTTLREGEEFNTAYQALSDEDRMMITEECKSPAGFERFCDAFVNVGSTTPTAQ